MISGQSVRDFFPLRIPRSERAKLGCLVVRDRCSAAKLHTSFFLKNGSSWPRTSKAADGGKHAFPESGLQIAENALGEELHGTDYVAAETRLAAHVGVLTLPQLARSRSPKMLRIRLLVIDGLGHATWSTSPVSLSRTASF